MQSTQKVRSIFRTLNLSFLTVCFSALFLAGLVQIYLLAQTNHQSIIRSQELVARQAAMEVAHFLEHKFAVIETGLSTLHWAPGGPTQCKQVLESLLGIERSLQHLVCLDNKGRPQVALSRYSRIVLGKFLHSFDQDIIKQVTQHQRYISAVRVDEETFEPEIIVGAGIKDTFGDSRGILLAEINLKFMWDLVAQLNKEAAGQSYVVDRQGRLLAARDVGRVIKGEQLNSTRLVKAFIQDSTSVHTRIYRSLSGERVIGTVVPLSFPEWAIVTELPLVTAYAKVLQAMVFIAVFFLLLAVSASIVAMWASRRVVTPLIHLTGTASRIASGQIAAKALVEGPLEVRTLATTFNSMTTRLLEQTDALRKEVDQRVATEEKLRLSEERFDLALKAVNEGIWDWNLVTDEVHFDARWYTMCGYEPDEFPNTFGEWEKRVHPDDIDSVSKLIHQYLISEEELFYAEYRFQQKDGTYRWLLGRGMIVQRDDQGRGQRFVGTHLDISDRKAAEQQLRDNEEKLRLYMDNTHDGVFIIGADQRFLYVNQEMGNILGYKPDALIGQEYMQFLHKDRVELVAQGSSSRLSGAKVPQRYGITILNRIGVEREVEISVGKTVDSKGEAIVIGTLLDVTEQKAAEQEADRLRNLLANIVDSMPSILVGVDGRGRVTQWNATVEKATGIRSQRAQGKLLTEVFPQMQRELENIRKSIQTKTAIVEQKRTSLLGIEGGYEDVTIYPLITNGVEGAVIRIDDVTEKVRLEEMMIQSEKMLSVGGLAAGMAHEINNPLAGMLQTAEVMSNRLGKNVTLAANVKAAEQAGTDMNAITAFMEARGILRMLETIRSSGARVADIVENMLSFARKSEAATSTCRVEEIMDKTIALAATDYDLKQSYDFKRIDIRRDYDDQVPTVPCERAKIQQVLLNILRNGAQAMQAAGTAQPTFTIRTRFDMVRSMVCVEVEDNGPGMDEQTRRRVFEPFFTTKPVGVGTGLGLSVSYFIITENHKGEMSVESAPGKGARFIVRLPV